MDFSPEQMRYLEHGRVADVSRLAALLGWSPRPTSEAFDDFVTSRVGSRLVTAESAAMAEQKVLDLLARRRPVRLVGQPAEEGVVRA